MGPLDAHQFHEDVVLAIQTCGIRVLVERLDMAPHVHLITQLGSVANGHTGLLLVKGTREGEGWGAL